MSTDMSINTAVLASYLSPSDHDRSLQAARRHELNSVLRRQRHNRRNQRDEKRTDLWQWVAAHRAAWSRP